MQMLKGAGQNIMKLKEKNREEYVLSSGKGNAGRLPIPIGMIISAVIGYLSAGTRIGGSGVPLCPAAAAAFSPWNGFAAFAGAAVYMFINNTVTSSVTEIIAMPAVMISKAFVSAVTGKKLSPRVCGALSASAYVICGIIASFSGKIRAAVVFALIFRGIICGAAAYLYVKSEYAAQDGTIFSRENRFVLSAVYVLAVCILCGADIGILNAGRAVGMFAAMLAAYRSGSGSGSAAAALTMFAAGAASPDFLISAPIPVCAALVSGYFRRNGKPAASAAFLLSGLAGALIYGLPADSIGLLADMSAAAVLFCLLPDRLFRKLFSGEPAAAGTASAAAVQYKERLRFAAAAVADVRNSFAAAAEVLSEKETQPDISAQVCRKVCENCRSSAFCGESAEGRIENYFRSTEKLLEAKGSVSVNELHRSLDICPRRELLAETFNTEFFRRNVEKRLSDTSRCMREIASEQLESAEKMLEHLSLGADVFPFCDEEMSCAVNRIISSAGAADPRSALFTDYNGRVYIECFYEGTLNISERELTVKLSVAADRELAEPEIFRPGKTARLCFHEQENFAAEIGSAKTAGSDEASGDLGAVFRDGLGNLSIMLSDGMGSGARAAAESCMTVSAAVRMIKAGLGAEAAIRLVNILLLTKSPEECFSTVDLFTVNLFTGKAEFIKLGAAQTFIKSCGTIKTIESRTNPVGIVGSVETDSRSVRLDDGDEVVMMTDGICEECFPEVRELILSMGVTAQDCAERIIGIAERGMENDPCRRDDKTVYAVRLHKI